MEGSDHGLMCDNIYQHLLGGLSKFMTNIMIAGLFDEILN